MRIEVADDASEAAKVAARLVSEMCRDAVGASNVATAAFSGGSSPAAMLAELRDDETMPWAQVHVFQVDERSAPDGHQDRNHTQLIDSLAQRVSETNLYPMEVGQASEAGADAELARLTEAAARYSEGLRQHAGAPPVLDVVHLGMGSDGHTASLVPGDDLAVDGSIDVGVSAVYQGRRRLTITEPVLRAAHNQVWLIPGESKAPMVKRLVDGDTTIPAGRVVTDAAVLVLDRSAASELS